MYILAIETTGPHGSVALISDRSKLVAHKESRESMSHLKDLDTVAYVRFASVYREFKDANTFMDELKKLLG